MSQQSIVKVDIEEVFHGRQKHHDDNDPGTIIYYVFRIDKQQFERREHKFTGAQLLALVGLSPDKYRLFQLGKGHEEILPDEEVDLRKHGLERFKTVAKHANEGKEAAATAASSTTLRRMFDLLPEDEQFLNRNYDCWEAIYSGNTCWILIHNFKVPAGYNITDTTLALTIPTSYPISEIDMMYFSPGLQRQDGKGIGALSHKSLDEKQFQRWSRHRIAGEWRAGVDNLETHVLSVQSWLIDELKK